MYSSVKNIKAQAREQLLPHMWIAVCFTLFQRIVTTTCSFCLMFTPIGSGVISTFLMYELVNLLSALCNGLFILGCAAFFLNLYTGRKNCSLSDLFYAFTHGPDKAIKVSAVLFLVDMICTLPYTIYSLFIMPSNSLEKLMTGNTEAISFFAVSYLLLGLGEFIYFLIQLNFAPIYFMLVDMPDLPVSKAFKMSAWLMKGSKVRLFVLELSFLPLAFLSLLTFGIGNLWVSPYRNTASAAFYMDLSENRIK